MPLIQKQRVADNTLLGIWHIDEPLDWFSSQLLLNQSENLMLDSIRNPGRKLQWLSSRVLIRTMLETDQFIHLENDLNGKPAIVNSPFNISISHSRNLSALIVSKDQEVGIDIEIITPKIERVANKFLNEEEKLCIDKRRTAEHLYTIWSAKEAMYKLYGKRQLDFSKHLSVVPFFYQESGVISGKIEKDGYIKEVKISYQKINNYMLAYVCHKSINT
ncbi:MAG: 4'-phosphopantetheinyl transferase superfamily protein [Chitinophagales bacterium]|nr:4'-phosphopantetheinyl transferase superfamily protein [Chitinophagales bacterium]